MVQDGTDRVLPYPIPSADPPDPPPLDLAVEPGELRRTDGLAVGGLDELPVRW